MGQVIGTFIAFIVLVALILCLGVMVAIPILIVIEGV